MKPTEPTSSMAKPIGMPDKHEREKNDNADNACLYWGHCSPLPLIALIRCTTRKQARMKIPAAHANLNGDVGKFIVIVTSFNLGI